MKAFSLAALAVVASACSSGGGPSGPAPSASVTSSEIPAPPAQYRWTEIKSELAPLIVNLTEAFPGPTTARRGELVRVGKSQRTSTWKGVLEEQELEREGLLFEVQTTPGGTTSFAFQSDLGGEVAVSSTDALCEALRKKGPFELSSCRTNMQRAHTPDGAVVSYVPCTSGACPLAVERDGKLGAIALPGLASAIFMSGKKKSVIVAQMRSVKDNGQLTGGSVAIVTLDGLEPVRTAEFASDEIDARNVEHVVSKVVKVSVTHSEVRLSGKIEEHDKSGALTSSKPIDETHPLPPLD